MTISIPSADAKGFPAKVREFALVALGLTGNPLDAFLTRRDLKDAGLIDVRMGGARVGGVGAGGVAATPVRPVIEPAVDLTPPPPPGGFIATSGITQIMFETAAPVYRQGHGHARTKVYAANWDGVSPLPTFADAVLYTDFPGNIGVAPFDPASNLRLWATWTSVDGAESEPAGGTNGVAAATGLLEDQHIANLTVGKLLAGSLSVGQYIQSADYLAGTNGWRIATLAGGQAYMEINGGATIGGLVVGADHIRSSNYVLNTQGYRLKSDGTGQIGGFAVTNDGVQSTTYVAGVAGWRLKNDGTGQIGAVEIGADYLQSVGYIAGTTGWRLKKNGDILTPQFTLVGGVATFSGLLSAATISVGTAGSPVVFRDTTLGAIDLQSTANGVIQFHGETKVVVGGVDTWPPVTGTNVTFTCGNGATPIARRLRSGTVRFQIIASALVDNNLSLWYRINSGAWVYMTQTVEPQTAYGAAAAVAQLDRAMASGETIEFGFGVTDSAGAPNDTTKTELRYGSLAVQGINF